MGRRTAVGSFIAMLMVASSVFVSSGVALADDPEPMHPTCNNNVTDPLSSAQGSYGKMSNTCDVDHFRRMVSVCVQHWNGSSWACINGTYRKTYAAQGQGAMEVTSGWACTHEDVRIRGRFIAWNESNQVGHDSGAKYSNVAAGSCASSVGVGTILPDMPIDPDILDSI
jgi:hypothetical protein